MPCASTGISSLVLGRRLLVASRAGSAARAVDVGVDQPDLPARCAQRDREVGRDGGLADAAFAAADRDQGPRRSRPRSSRSVLRERRGSKAPRRAAPPPACRARPLSQSHPTMNVATPFATLRERIRSSCGRSVKRFSLVADAAAHRKSRIAACHYFSRRSLPIIGVRRQNSGVGRPQSRPFDRRQGPVGAKRAVTFSARADGEQAGGPWGELPREAGAPGRKNGSRCSISSAPRPDAVRRRRLSRPSRQIH